MPMNGASSIVLPEMSRDASEELVSVSPLIVRRRVAWGECDPAGVVYTPRFADYAASARDYWFRHVIGHHDRPHPARKQIVFPMRAMQFDFASMIAADDVFEMKVTLAELGNRSFTLEIAAVRPAGASVFSARLTQVAFDQATGQAVAIPAALRARMAELAPISGGAII